MKSEKANKPLLGKRILVTRARNQAYELSARIQGLGGEAVHFPVIKTIPPKDSELYRQALEKLHIFDWVIFTSINGVDSFFSKLKEYRIDIRTMSKAKIAAIGPKTAQALEDKGLMVHVLPNEFKAEGLVDALEVYIEAGQKVLLPRADIARKVLPEKLKEKGLDVMEVVAYETVIDAENKEEIIAMLRKKMIHMITYTSSSTVKNFLEALKDEPLEELLKDVTLASIGPITTETAQKLGLHIEMTAKEYTIPGLVETIAENISLKGEK